MQTGDEREMCDDLGNGVDSMLEDWARQRLSDGYALGQLEEKLRQAIEVIRGCRAQSKSSAKQDA